MCSGAGRKWRDREHMWNHRSKLAGWQPGNWNLQHLQRLVENEMMGLCKKNDSCTAVGRRGRSCRRQTVRLGVVRVELEGGGKVSRLEGETISNS